MQVSRVKTATGLSVWREQWQELFIKEASLDLACSYAWQANDFIFLRRKPNKTCYIAHNGDLFLGAMTAESQAMKYGGLVTIPYV